MSTKNSPYKPEYADKVRDYAILGATDRTLGVAFGVSERTISRWKKKHPEFKQAYEEAKLFADAKVASVLYGHATGYHYEEEEVIKVYDAESGNFVDEVVKVKKFVKPNLNAAMHWLRNRQREHWSDKSDVDTGGLVSTIIDEIMNTSRGLPSALPSTQKYIEKK